MSPGHQGYQLHQSHYQDDRSKLWQIKHHDGQHHQPDHQQYITLITPYISRWWVWRDCWSCCWSPLSPPSSGGCQDPWGPAPSWTSPPDSSTWVRPWPGWWEACQAPIQHLTINTITSITSITSINIITWVKNNKKVFIIVLYTLGNQLNYPAYDNNHLVSDYQDLGELPQEPPYYQERIFVFFIMIKWY